MGKQSVWEKSKTHQTAIVQLRVNGEDIGSLGQAQIYDFSSNFSIAFADPGVALIEVTGAPPTGTAGGDLTGTYPNPTLNIHGATAKTTPVNADELPIADSAASFALKKLTWANLKATLKTYFDTLYTAIGIVPNTAPAAGQILVGNAGGTAYAPVAVSGAGTLSSAGVLALTAASATVAGSLAANDYSALQALQHAALGGM